MTPEQKFQKLSDIVVTIELTLLSVIQGVALYFLADNARGPLLSLDYAHWLYVAIAFTILITFWSQALVHVLSFISWPLEFVHNFLYFAVIITEVMMFASIADPLRWFAANTAFFFVSGLLYYADLRLLKSKERNFQLTENQKNFFAKNLADQELAFSYLVPAGFSFSLIATALVWQYPQVFIAGNWHLLLAGIELLLGIGTLAILLPKFKQTIALIESL